MNSAPNLTTNLNSTNALLNKILACDNAKTFYNASSGSCYAAGSVGKWAICALTEQCDGKDYRTGCQLKEPSAGNWTIYDDHVESLGHKCVAVCFNFPQ